MTQSISLDHRLPQTLYDPNTEDFTAAAYPLIPLTEPGMPPAGPDFIAHAIVLGDEIDEATAKKKKSVPVGTYLTNLYRNALYRQDFHLPISHKSSKELIPVPFLPGHYWGKKMAAVEVYGPRRKAKVMVVGKLPGYYEMERMNATAGPAMTELANIFEDCGIAPETYEEWYVTFACKFAPPFDITAVPAAWIKNCAILL
jgi:hypothetical protein